MLYQPSFGTSPPGQFTIFDNFDGHQGQAFFSFKQGETSAKRPLDEFLKGFGLLIPPKNTCISKYPEECEAFETALSIGAQELNVFVLNSIVHINIKWVDSLTAHLEYNRTMNILYLF